MHCNSFSWLSVILIHGSFIRARQSTSLVITHYYHNIPHIILTIYVHVIFINNQLLKTCISAFQWTDLLLVIYYNFLSRVSKITHILATLQTKITPHRQTMSTYQIDVRELSVEAQPSPSNGWFTNIINPFIKPTAILPQGH